VDWNCDGDTTDADVARNINQGVSWNNNATLDTLTSQNDWDHLVYTGGAIAQPGASVTLPAQTEVIDIDAFTDLQLPDAPTTNGIDLLVQAPPTASAPPTKVAVISVDYDNYGITSAASTVLTATLGAGLTYVGDNSGITPTVAGNVVTWDLGNLDLTAGQKFFLQLGVPNDSLGTQYNVTLAIGSAGTDDNPSNNSAKVTVTTAMHTYLPLAEH
jgi:hypothetical protein